MACFDENFEKLYIFGYRSANSLFNFSRGFPFLNHSLLREQIRVIEKYPLKDLLNRFPAKLCDLESSNDSWRSDIASLLFAIIDSATALNLPAPNGDGNVADKLFAIRQKIRLGALQLIQFQPPVDAVVASSPDRNIWAAVFSLIADLKPHHCATPWFKMALTEQQIKIISECPLKK
ncbi:hypothetical protein E4U56_003632 [Claviceps arundinis]|uniref:Uncharacterized protein n=1 Tax=Claviceps arundinis TaxID=1623583 RepID=A0A9P7MPI5_9HYPO|nr:hypothetical protein E4U56_003632 [Claviceps arundinis]